MNLVEQYQAEADQIEKSRLESISSVGLGCRIGPFVCYHLTARAWCDLKLSECGVLEGNFNRKSAYEYVLRNSVDYPLGCLKKWKIERFVNRSFKNKRLALGLIKQIDLHLRAAFSEMPEIARRTESISFTIAPVEGVYSAIDRVAHRYGMNPNDVVDMPLRQIFASMKCEMVQGGHKLLEPKPLREIKSRYLKKEGNG